MTEQYDLLKTEL